MRPTLLPRLVNGPFEDPALFIRFAFTNRAIMFDLGDIHALSTRDILKLNHVFITHTHMDHFVGFDRLLRTFLGREKELNLYGPEGFIRNIEGKLLGYQWNLLNNYRNKFSLNIVEIRNNERITKTYHCQNRFQSDRPVAAMPLSSPLLEKSSFTVSATILDHRIPCLGLSIKERFHINIKKDALQNLGLTPGPWISRLKEALFENRSLGATIDIPFGDSQKEFSLRELADQIALITPGQKITYITDIAYSPSNLEHVISLALDSDHLFIEAAFLNIHADLASKKHHLTAKQAGHIAALSHAKKFTLFHFSPRYTGQEHMIAHEAAQAYHQAKGL